MVQRDKVFSIVIPTYRRPHQLASCLRSLARLDYPRNDFEVVVVDDGGEGPIESVITASGVPGSPPGSGCPTYL